MKNNSPRFVFFGTPDIAATSLAALFEADMAPTLVVTAPDRHVGRGLVLTPSLVAQWAHTHGIPTLKPEKLSDSGVGEQLKAVNAELFVVVAYGKIIPRAILDIPKLGTLNMHPSLLPKYRGPSPIESQILGEASAEGVGVSVMLLDEQMDHGPVLAQENAAEKLVSWPVSATKLREILARQGAALLVQTIPQYVSGGVTPTPQDHNSATYCSMITKEDALLNLSRDPYQNYLKVLAYSVWPRAYFFTEKDEKKTRVVVTSARFENDALVLERVVPEGKKEIPYSAFLS